MQHDLSTSQGIHTCQCIISVIYFTFAYWTSLCIAQEALLKTERIVSLIWFPHSPEKHCSCSSSVLCSLWEPRHDTRSIPAHARRTTQHHFIILSFSPFQVSFLKLHSTILLMKEGKLTGFCYQNFPITGLIPHWALTLKTRTAIYIYAQHMSTYVLCICHCIKKYVHCICQHWRL